MIKMNEITDMKYDYDHIYLINPFNFRNESNFNFSRLFTLKFYFFSYYNKEFNFKISISEYLKFIDKLHNIYDNSCHICKSNSEYCCGYCHKFFCIDCFKTDIHNCKSYNEINDRYLSFIKKITYKEYFIQKFNNKIKLKNSINDYPKDWTICSCNKDKVIVYCRHGLKCIKCHGCNCFEFLGFLCNEFRFFYLDIFFMKTESVYLNEYKSIENDIKNFNENIAKLFLKYKDKIENENRKRRFIKHFTDLRNNFIAYHKLKIIVINIIRRNQNINLLKLYEHYKKYKLGFNKFIFSKDLSLDKNIIKLSNFFATQNAIFFEKIDEKEKEKINSIEKYLKAEDFKEKPKENKIEKIKLEEAFIYITLNNENEIGNYINSRNVFEFHNEGGLNVFSIKFNDKFLDKKKDIFYNGVYNNSISVHCKPFSRLKNEKWAFIIGNNNQNWIFLLKQNYKIFELEMAEKIHMKNNGTEYDLFEIKKDKFLIYEKNYVYSGFDHSPKTKKITRIYIINSTTAYMNKEIVIPFTSSIENLFYIDKYKNIVFIFLAFPLLNLVLLDFELNQINTIIDLINPLYIPDIYEFRPIIKDIKTLKNNKLYLIGGQPPNVNDAHPDNYQYDFKII